MSCSIPLLIKPICQDGKCYIDGGVQANYPVNICLQNENCDEREIFGFKNCLATIVFNNTNKAIKKQSYPKQ